MEVARRVYDYVTSPEPVVRFQKFCAIRPKHGPTLNQPEPAEEKLCNGKCHCEKNGNPKSTNCEYTRTNGISAEVIDDYSANHVANGNYDHVNGKIEYSNIRQRNGETHPNTYNFKVTGNHDINQNGTFRNQDNHELSSHTNASNGYIHKKPQPAVKSEPSGPDFIIGNYLIFAIFRFGAELGNEFFYMVFYSYSMWNFDSKICLQIVLVWVLIMYFGQSMKDIIRWPRPASPPVFRLEDRYSLEYGMPSTHAMVGTAIPYCLLYFTHGRYEYTVEIAVCIAISWCTLVCLSRLYLGMHTILDILVGLLMVTILLFILVPQAEVSVLFLVSHEYGGLITVAGAFTLGFFYPSLDKWSTARGDTTVFLGVASGLLFGTWLNNLEGLLEADNAILPYPNTILQFDWVVHGLYRLVIGVIAIAVMRIILKLFTFKLLCFIFRKDPESPEAKTCLMIELPYKYISYFILAVGASYLAPKIFIQLGIDRPSYYKEVL